jgi:hypothetical protein
LAYEGCVFVTSSLPASVCFSRLLDANRWQSISGKGSLSADYVRPGPVAQRETGQLCSLVEQLGNGPRRRDLKTNTLIDGKS